MGYLKRNLKVNTVGFLPQQFTWDLSEGIIYGVTASIVSGSTQPNTCWIVVSILDGGDSIDRYNHVLISSPFGNRGPTSWDGRHPLITEAVMMARVYAPQNTELAVAWSQFMPSDELTAKQTLDA